MRYYRLAADDGSRRLVARDGDEAYDLTAAESALQSPIDLARLGRADGDADLDAAARKRLAGADPVTIEDLETPARPLVADEVWAAGVTYAISEAAREAESGLPEVYARVYEAERPELFFKATPSRTVGPGDAVGVRGDSDWNVPEPELGVVLYEGDTVGYTVGNDVSSRDIEGANPLYLPQAKVYDRCCAVGPCVASPATVGDPHDLDMRIEITRDGDTAFADATSTGEMVRTCEELVSYLNRGGAVPESCVLLTGTSLVPPDEFTLEPGDTVRIEIETIGALENTVTRV